MKRRCKLCEHWLPFEENRGICRMGNAPEPLVWMNLTFWDQKGMRHQRPVPGGELHTDPEFGCCLFEPNQALIEIRKLQEEIDAARRYESDLDDDEFDTDDRGEFSF